jgi:hypothetical protein
MLEPEDELHSEGSESDDAEVNRDLFKDQHGSVKFFLHESIKKRFSRRNLTRNIEVRREPLDLTRLIIDSFPSAETWRNCTGHSLRLRHGSCRCLI